MLNAPSQRGGPIIWPLQSKLFHPLFFQHRPKWTGGRPRPTLVVAMPWDVGRPGITVVPVGSFRYVGPIPQVYPWPRVVHQLLPPPPTDFKITGFTKDSAGAVLANCVVHLFRTSDDVLIKQITGGADGSYSFGNLGGGGLGGPSSYYVVAYKAGAPDLAGTTVNTLTGL